MRIGTRIRKFYNIATLIVESNGTTLEEDVSNVRGILDEHIIEDLLHTTFDLVDYEGRDKVKFIRSIVELYLNDAEQKDLVLGLLETKL